MKGVCYSLKIFMSYGSFKTWPQILWSSTVFLPIESRRPVSALNKIAQWRWHYVAADVGSWKSMEVLPCMLEALSLQVRGLNTPRPLCRSLCRCSIGHASRGQPSFYLCQGMTHVSKTIWGTSDQPICQASNPWEQKKLPAEIHSTKR